MSSKPRIDLLVIGSGPVGLSAAIEAQRLGLSCRIIERKDKRRSNDSRAVIIHPRVLELLEAHPRIIQDIDERAGKISHLNIELVTENTTISIAREEQRFGDTDYASLCALPQYLTEKSLEDELNEGGGKVEYGIAFESLAQLTEDEVTATVVQLASGEKEDITAKYVMGADGGRSSVRDCVGINLDRHSSSVLFALSDVKIAENSPDKKLPGFHIMLTEGGPCAMIPLLDGTIRFFMQAHEGILRDDVTLDKEFFEKHLREMTGKQFTLELGEWQTIFEVTHGVSDAYRNGRVFLAGDAAHVHSPIGGQGMNYGIWDAITLVSKIAWAERVLADHPEAKDAAEEILASYAEERHSMGRELVSKVKLATSIVTTRNSYLQKFRNALMQTVVPFVDKDMMRTAGQLDLAYKPSYSRFILPAPTYWFSSKSYICQPGQRLPNLVLEDGSKLYKQIDRVRHTWICINVMEPTDAVERCIRVTPAKEQTSVPAISKETLASPQAILVRPDLFVAAVDDSFEKLESAVKSIFGEQCFGAI
mmetsp:Transcript_36770/g.68153  ORF Transcript_36770/g.68153 Transcript_36770/m.68153 type:complete len:535 (+) Transcript_36770:115-1719(+)